MYKILNKNKELLILVVLSVILFCFQYGVEILNPRNILWLEGDSYTQFIGWSFYRNSNFFTFPLLKIFDYGMDVGSTIIYTDSLPLMAILFKPFSKFLPVDLSLQLILDIKFSIYTS